MHKAKIYVPTKTAMQSGKANSKKWILEFETNNNSINPLMGWKNSRETMSQIKLEFTTKNEAIAYANKNKLNFYVIEPKKRNIIIKSYSDNFLKE
tara:strand:- start:93 stop:377 length:285 start_codon:yes stop_codon:yes gene_type:complete